MFHFSKKKLYTKPDKPAPQKLLPKTQNMAGLQHNEQQGNMQKTKTKKEKKPKERKLKVKVKQTVERTAQTPETVLRESGSYLTEYELEEVKKYKEVWYLGQKADKTCYSKDTETQDIQSANFGYDTKEGSYRVVMHDHIAYRFEILEEIGAGYSGQVLKCVDHKTKALVAIKVIRKQDGIDPQGQAEVDMLDALRNIDENNTANILHMKEHFYFRNHLCITFELLEKDLYSALMETNQRGLGEKDIRKYTKDVLKCLQMLKEERIIHGDIKLENILLDKKGKHAVVADFAGSCFMENLSEYQPLMGTLYYMSPEILLGKMCCTATDMWSLGCTLAELYTGNLLFDGDDDEDQLDCIMKVLGVLPTELLKNAPRRNKCFDADGVPLNIEDIKLHSCTLAKQLNSDDVYFLDFIKRCLEYDPTKRLTPREALQHPWIRRKNKTKAVKRAVKTIPDATPISRGHKGRLAENATPAVATHQGKGQGREGGGLEGK